MNQSIARHRFAVSVTLTFFSSICNLSHFSRVSCSFKIGPEIALAARGSFGENLRSAVDSPISDCYSCYNYIFSSICELSQFIRVFYSFKIGPEVVLAARWSFRVNLR